MATLGLGLLLLMGPSVRGENTVAVNEVLKLKGAGVADETIVSFIQGKNLDYDLSADNILRLRDQGVSSAVLNAMLSTTRGATPPVAPSPVPAPIPGAQPAIPASPGVPNAPTVTVTPVMVGGGAPVANPDVAYFQQELTPYGRWILLEDGQHYWQPTIVATTPSWRPYWDRGHWVWTDHGWYWSSDYPWGWAVFHYGRWHLHPHHGWLWYPDRVWGPAWVVWRSGGDYCGWAPLPPGSVYDTVGGHFSFHGRHVEAGFEFGLGLAHFSFCALREFGEPVHRRLYVGPEASVIYNRTVVVNHYSLERGGPGGEARPRVFNHGIEVARVTGARGREFESVRIQDLDTPAPGRAHEHLDPHARTLDVYRPHFNGRR